MSGYGAQHPVMGSISGRAPIFRDGDSLEAEQFTGQQQEYLASQLRRISERHGSSALQTLLTAAAPCFPTGSAAALWFESVRGMNRGPSIGGPTAETYMHLYLWECLQYILAPLDTDNPDVTPAVLALQHGAFRQRILEVLLHLQDLDLRSSPSNIHHLILSSHQRYFTANPAQAPANPNAPRNEDGTRDPYEPREAANRADYTYSHFGNDHMRTQFIPPDNAEVDRLRTEATTARRQLVGSIESNYEESRAFFSGPSTAIRVAGSLLDPVTHFSELFKAQWVRCTEKESDMLRALVPTKKEPYAHFISKFQTLVRITAPEPPFPPTLLAKHFMEVLHNCYGEPMFRHVQAHWLSLRGDPRRSVSDLYTAANTFYEGEQPTLIPASSSSTRASATTTPTRPRAEQSPARGRTPYPNPSPGRTPHSNPSPGSGSRQVSWQANHRAYDDSPASGRRLYQSPPRHHPYESPPRHHRYQSPSDRRPRYSSPEHHSYYTTPSPSSRESCMICKKPHANGICFYNCHPDKLPANWRPETYPLERLRHYIHHCESNRYPFRAPVDDDDRPAVRTAATPPRMSAATASRPQSTRTIAPTTSTRAPTYNRQPPPEQLRRQQEREEHRAAHVAFVDDEPEPEFDGSLHAAVLEAGGEGTGGEGNRGGSWDGEEAAANAATRAQVLRQQREAAALEAAAPGQPAWPAPRVMDEEEGGTRAGGSIEEGTREQEQRKSVVPEPRLKRKPPPVGFTADQLPRGMLPAELQAREKAHLAVAQQPAVQRTQALPLASGVVPMGARLPRGGAGLVQVPLQQLLNFAGVGGYITEPMPLVVSGVGAEQYAMGVGQVSVLMAPALVGQIFGGAGGGPQANASNGTGEQGQESGGEGTREGAAEANTITTTTLPGGEQRFCVDFRDLEELATIVPGTEREFEAPSVTYLEATEAARCVSLLCGRSKEFLCTVRAMLDSGANVFAIARWLAEALQLNINTNDSMALRGASKLPSSTMGSITTEIDITLCHGTEHEVVVRVPLQVVDTGDRKDWGLLLGTGFLALVGGKLDFLHSTFAYRPRLMHTPNHAPTTNLATHTLPITTTISNPSDAFMRSLMGPAASGAQ